MKTRSVQRWLIFAGVVAGLMVLGTSDALAQVNPDNRMDRIVNLYRVNAGKWENVLRAHALRLFWLLAAIECMWAGMRLVLKGADIQEWTAEMVNQILFIGFFLSLLLNSSVWSRAIISSFLTAAGQASVAAGGSAAISPSNVFDVGLMVASQVMEQASFWSPGDSLGLMIAALVVIVCFALIAAFMIVALVESYIVISSGVLLMGFGGSRWTKDHAVKLIVYAVSVGAKLFVLQLLVGLGEAMVRGWVADFENDNAEIFMMVGSSIVMLALVKMIPGLVQGLINGVSIASDGGLAGTVRGMGQMAVGAAAAAVTGGAGAAYALSGAKTLASEQLKNAEMNGTAPESRMGRFAAMTRGMASNLGQAAVDDVGPRLGMAGRMGRNMRHEAKGLRLERTKPATGGGPDAPAPGGGSPMPPAGGGKTPGPSGSGGGSWTPAETRTRPVTQPHPGRGASERFIDVEPEDVPGSGASTTVPATESSQQPRSAEPGQDPAAADAGNPSKGRPDEQARGPARTPHPPAGGPSGSRTKRRD